VFDYHSAMKIFSLLPWLDWVALLLFFAAWVGYAVFARAWPQRRPSLLATTNQIRRQWILQSIARDPRMLDGIITQNLSHSPAFFASTSIIIMGGLLAVLGTNEKATELVREIPFATITSGLLLDFKLIVLLGIFVYAFFRFTWSIRQYTFVALLIGAMPPAREFAAGLHDAEKYADKASRQVGLAAETFNDGLRAYYFSFAAMGWILSPVALILGSLIVVLILYGREFHSDVLELLRS
jgi:uncharacterized membrane protein